MLHIEKLSEKNLGSVIKELFNKEPISQKRFKSLTRTFIADYALELDSNTLVFEFDGPTHFTDAKTQLRDIEFTEYCKQENMILVRIPYFIQVDGGTLPVLFDADIINEYNLYETIDNITCDYVSGFHDKKIVYPGNFNSHGWFLFWTLYIKCNTVDRVSVMREIYDSISNIDTNVALGVDWQSTVDKNNFVNNYPT